ncbi:cell death abnormality protein 1-like [Saccostrea cucullata]|uniref:cell death abnormality protein 1-like n=1 Tax=Saccostrea cuccullata TaxID=36930 RepID=UPI002ED694CF
MYHLIVLLYISTISVGDGPCPGFFKGCCPDTRWDPNKDICIECPNGFVGENCSISCKFPYYGKKCEIVCNCNKSSCNVTHGCPTSTNENLSFPPESQGKSHTPNKIRTLLVVFGCICLVMFISIVCIILLSEYSRCPKRMRRLSSKKRRE